MSVVRTFRKRMWPSLQSSNAPAGARKNMALAEPPRNARDVFVLRGRDRLIYEATIAFARVSGCWRYPAPRHGDLERMTLLDKIYWVYKAVHPIRRAQRGSGLEAHFARQRALSWELPPLFEPQAELSLSSAGDLMSHPFLNRSGETLFGAVARCVLSADVAMANLEGPIVLDGANDLVLDAHSAPCLTIGSEAFEVLKGFEGRTFAFLATACNHSLDLGEAGAAVTLAELERHGIAHNGINATESDALRPTVLERKGIKLGLVAYTFGLNAHQPPAGRPEMVNRLLLNDGLRANDLSRFEQQIARGKADGVDFFVAHLHWGMEHEFYPRPEQLELAHALAELGVDAIIGHHPHVVQPMEQYRTRRDPDRLVPIYYSLGNLTNPFSAAYVCRSAIAQITLVKGRTGGGREQTYVKNAAMSYVRQTVAERERTLALIPD